MGGKSGPAMDSSDFVEESCAPSQPSKPTKTIQGGSSLWSGSETGKMVVGNGGPDSCQVVFMKDNVSLNPARDVRERTSGLLRLTTQGSSLLMTWTPTLLDSGGRCGFTVMNSAEQDRDLHAIRSVSLAEMRSIRRHTPSVGLQYIIIVLTSGLSFPPLYFHTGGVKDFFATLRIHALLVRSIDDPSVYFVNNVHDSFQIQAKENEANEEANEEENEKEMDKEKEKEKELELGQELEQEEREIEKKVSEEAANSVGARRYDLELVYFTQQNGAPALVLERAPPPLSRSPPLNLKEGATFSDDEVHILDPKPVTLPDITYNHPPSSMHDTMNRDTSSRKRTYRRSPKVLPTLPPADNLSLTFTPSPIVRNTQPSKRYRRSSNDLPTLPPAENITLQFTPTFTPRFCPVSGKQPRKTVDLVLSPAEKASSIPVDRRYRKTFDLVLSPDATRVNVSPVIPHTYPNFVGSSIVPGQSGSPASFASTVVPPLPRTVEEEAAQSLLADGQDGALSQSPSSGRLSDDAVPSNASEGVGHFFRLYCSGSFREGISLPVSWRSRLHLAEMSSEGGALARRRREWWLGTSLSASVATGIPSHVISLLFTSELFTRLMVDSGLTYKALNALKYIDKFGILKHVTSGDICQYLKTFFSKAIRNRLRWQRMGGVVVDNMQPLATSMIQPYKQLLGVPKHNNVQPPHQQSGVSQEYLNRFLNREKPIRRWVQRSARAALRKIFEDWGYRECTPDETLALSAQFQGNPDSMQIMQLFRNWSQQKRRQDRDADNLPRILSRQKDRDAESYSSQAQPTLGHGGLRRKRTEAASQAQDAQRPLPRVKKRPALGEFSGSTSLQSESQLSSMDETAFKVDPRGILRQVFEERGCRKITLGEAFALSIGFQGNPSATQVQQLFGDWAQDWQHRQALQHTKLLEDSARQAEDARHARHAYLYRKKLPVKKLPIKRLPVVSTGPGCNSLQSETQPTSVKDTTPAPPAMEESRQLITERQALLRLRLLDESARQVEAARQACGHTMKLPVPISVSGCSSPQLESQSTSMEYTPPGPLASEESRRRVQGSSRGGRRQSRAREVSLPVTQ